MLQLVLAATLTLFAMHGVGQNPIPVQCLGEEALRSSLRTEMPELRLFSLPRNSVTAFMAAFNALPPATNAEADGVLIMMMPDAPQAIVAFFRDSCLVGRASLPAPLVESLLGAVAKEA
jgi:hypothetical protein